MQSLLVLQQVSSHRGYFVGLHFIIAAAIAYICAGNIIASALGTAFGNPLTFPFIWAASYKLGMYMLVDNFQGQVPSIHLGRLFRDLDLNQLWQPVIKPMLLGCLPFALGFGLLFYIVTYMSVATFQAQRRKRMLKKRAGGDNVRNGQTV